LSLLKREGSLQDVSGDTEKTGKAGSREGENAVSAVGDDWGGARWGCAGAGGRGGSNGSLAGSNRGDAGGNSSVGIDWCAGWDDRGGGWGTGAVVMLEFDLRIRL
jgi:hypothetical protein